MTNEWTKEIEALRARVAALEAAARQAIAVFDDGTLKGRERAASDALLAALSGGTSALDAATEALRAANERLAQTVDYAAKVDAELETLRADSARQLADAGVARAVHEYDQRVKSEKALRAANEEIARLTDALHNARSRAWSHVLAGHEPSRRTVEHIDAALTPKES